jgi:hypothetical protein
MGNLREGEQLGDQEQGGWTMWRQTSGKWDLRGWRGEVEDRSEWRKLVKEAKALQGL